MAGNGNLENVIYNLNSLSCVDNGGEPVVVDSMEESSSCSGANEHADQSEEEIDLLNTLIITNVDTLVFEDARLRELFESAFRVHGVPEIQYLKSFRRARVQYETFSEAAKARITLHETELNGTRIKCYFGQPKEKVCDGSSHLKLPPLTKQFLISPPASPPVGWEPVMEGTPVVNYDLIAALANLTPGEAHELHPQSEKCPGIVVHICEDPDGFSGRPKMVQTKRPEI